MRIINDTLLESAVDLSNSWTSSPIWLGHLSDFSVQLLFSGSPLGVFTLECSNDKEKNVETGDGVENWTPIIGSNQSITEAGDHTWAVSGAGYRWARVQWVADVGSVGTLDSARMNGKGV